MYQPFADINSEWFVDKHQQPEVTDLICYVREVHREDKLSPIIPAIYQVLEDVTGASDETLEWTIGTMIRAPDTTSMMKNYSVSSYANSLLIEIMS